MRCMNMMLRRAGCAAAAVGTICFVLPAMAQTESWIEDENGVVHADVVGGFDSPDADAFIRRLVIPADQLDLAALTGGGIGLRNVGTLSVGFVAAGIAPEGDTPMDAAFTVDGSQIVIAHRDTQNLVILAASDRSFVQAIALSGSPNALALSSDGIHAVTANLFEDTASIVNLVTGIETAVVPVGAQPGVVRITPDGTTAVVGNTVDASVSVIDIATATELRRISGLGFTSTVTFAFESGAVVATFSEFALADNITLIHPDFFNDQIHFVDITTGAITTRAAANRPRNVAVTPDGTKAVVSHPFGTANVISVLDVATQTISKTINIGTGPWGPIAIRPNGRKACVAVLNACRVVNLLTDAVSADLPTASVNKIITTSDGAHAQTIGFRGSLINYGTSGIIADLNNFVSTNVGAVSPVNGDAVMIANTFGEDLVFVNGLDQPTPVLDVVPSGPPPELDKSRTAAISPDGSKAVVAGILSDTASIIDLASGTVDAIVDVGDRPAEVAFTPDGSRAVVANLDSTFLSVIDIATASVTNITISRRASQVEISPDGQFAYVAVVADGDGVWRVNLNTLSVQGPKRITGNMGGVGFLFNQTSGMTFSHDGATLVTCGSFSNTITVIDTTAWLVVATVPVGTFPVRAVFSSDDSTIYVSNRDSNNISVVNNAGAASTVTGTIPVGIRPFEMDFSPDGSTLYLLNTGLQPVERTVGVVDLATATMTAVIPLPNSPGGLRHDPVSSGLYVSTGNSTVTIGPGPLVTMAREGQFSIIDTTTNAIVQQIDTGFPPSMMTFHPTRRFAVVPSPLADGVHIVGVQIDCPGDTDGDLDVDLSDLAAVLGQFGLPSGATIEDGDVDGDGDVDLTDLAIVLLNFGANCS